MSLTAMVLAALAALILIGVWRIQYALKCQLSVSMDASVLLAMIAKQIGCPPEPPIKK